MSRRVIAVLLVLGIWTVGCNVVGPLSALPFMRPVPAALDVLECDLEPSTMGGAGEVLSDSGWPTPDQAVADLVDDGWVMPRTGYQLEAADAHQALYVFRNGPAVKLALLLSDEVDGRPNGGWVVIELPSLPDRRVRSGGRPGTRCRTMGRPRRPHPPGAPRTQPLRLAGNPDPSLAPLQRG